MSQGYVRQCVFFNGLPGSCRYNERCAFSHDLTIHINSKFKYVAPNISHTRTVVSGTDPKIIKEQTTTEQYPEQTEQKEVKTMYDTYSTGSELQPLDREAYLSKKFTLGRIPFLPPTSDLA
ncbi:unnamed protein product [Auanema sp. JU1783]|nr:unnamed protein product [Auanema sp. JU1783]